MQRLVSQAGQVLALLALLVAASAIDAEAQWCTYNWAGCTEEGTPTYHAVFYMDEGGWDCASAGGCHWGSYWSGSCANHHINCEWFFQQSVEDVRVALKEGNVDQLRKLVAGKTRSDVALDHASGILRIRGCKAGMIAQFKVPKEVLSVLADE